MSYSRPPSPAHDRAAPRPREALVTLSKTPELGVRQLGVDHFKVWDFYHCISDTAFVRCVKQAVRGVYALQRRAVKHVAKQPFWPPF